MKVSITGKNENALLKRTELVFEVADTATPPARKELREKVAALENVKPEQVIISKIEHGFGSTQVSGKAHVYASVADLEKTELPYMVGRNTGVKKGKKAEGKEPAAEAPAEKPAKAEEKPAEAKTEKPAEEKGKEKAAEKKEDSTEPKEKKEGEQ